MSDDVVINIITKVQPESKQELLDFQTKVNEVQSRWTHVKMTILQELPRALGLINIGIQALRSLVSLGGGTISPFYNAILSGIAASSASLLAMATAWTTVPGGQMVYVLANAAIVGINVGIVAGLIANQNATKEELDQMMDRISQTQAGMGGLIRSIGSGGRMY